MNPNIFAGSFFEEGQFGGNPFVDPQPQLQAKQSDQSKKCIGFSPDETFPFHVPVSIFSQVDDCLQRKRIVVITGDNQFKSAIVRQHVKRNLGSYSFIAWIDLSLVSGIHLGASKIAKAFNLNARRSMANLLKTVEEIFLREKDWLVVLDHFDEALELDRWKQLQQRAVNGEFILLAGKGFAGKSDIAFDQLPDRYPMRLYKKLMGGEVSQEENDALQNLHQLVDGDPVTMRFLIGYAGLIHDQNKDANITDVQDAVKATLQLKSNTGESTSERVFKLIFNLCMQSLEDEEFDKGSNVYDEASDFINAWAHFQSENLPFALAESYFAAHDDPKLSAMEALILLSNYGFINTFSSNLDMTTLTFSMDKRVQDALFRRQKERGEFDIFFSISLKIAVALFDLDRKNLSEPSSTESFEYLALQLEKTLETAKEIKRLDDVEGNRNFLERQVQGFNSLGLFFSKKEAFKLALDCYEQANRALSDYQATFKDRIKVKNFLKSYGLKAEVLHNLGSAYLRIWETLPTIKREETIGMLERACTEFQLDIETHLRESLSKRKAYDRKHFIAYSFRALARAYKKMGMYVESRDILEKIYRSKEYVDWPKRSYVSRTKPLALMDLGVINRLIAREEELHDRRTLRALDVGSSTQPKHNLLNEMEGVFRTGKQSVSRSKKGSFIRYLKESVKLYESPGYAKAFPDSYKKDLGIALIRLGEGYVDLIRGGFFSKHSADSVVRALHSFLRARHLLSEHFKGEKSINEARASYRLAQLYHSIGALYFARLEIREAIETQQMFFGWEHPYLRESKLLEEKIEFDIERFVPSPFPKSQPLEDPTDSSSPLFPFLDALHQFYHNGDRANAAAKFLEALDCFQALSSLDVAASQIGEVYQALRAMKHVEAQPLPELQSPKFKRFPRREAFFVVFEKALGAELAKEVRKKKKNSFYQIVHKAHLKNFYETRFALGGIRESLSLNMSADRVGEIFLEDDIDMGFVDALFAQFDKIVEKVVVSFAEQIDLMGTEGREIFAHSCAVRICSYLTHQYRDHFEFDQLQKNMWTGLFEGKHKSGKIELEGVGTFRVSDILRQCGLRTREEKYFVLKEGGLSGSLGFRLLDEELDSLGDNYEVIDPPEEYLQERNSGYLYRGLFLAEIEDESDRTSDCAVQ